MQRFVRVALLLVAVGVATGVSGRQIEAGDPETPSAEAGTSPQFRGPAGQRLATGERLPVRWSEKKNVRWKAAIPGLGWSSPVIQEGRIWLTTATDDGRSLRALCLDETTGSILHNVEVFRKTSPGRIHPKNSHASPTPVLAANHIFVHFGAHGTACLDSEGRVVWKTELPYYHHHGPAASPVLAAGNLIIPCDGFIGPFYDKISRDGVESPQFVIGLDVRNGRTNWKSPRDGLHSYATPLVIETGGATQVVSPGGKRVVAYDPATGREIWWCRYGDGYSVVPRPAFGNGFVYVCTGYDTPALLAIRPDGAGDVTETHIAWRATRGVPLSTSPLLVDDRLYLVSDVGVMTCLYAISGDLLWKGRLGGNFSSSPVLADGHIYVSSEAGVTHVISASAAKYDRVATNKLAGRIFASPVVSGDALYLRTDKALYRVEEAENVSDAPIAP